MRARGEERKPSIFIGLLWNLEKRKKRERGKKEKGGGIRRKKEKEERVKEEEGVGRRRGEREGERGKGGGWEGREEGERGGREEEEGNRGEGKREMERRGRLTSSWMCTTLARRLTRDSGDCVISLSLCTRQVVGEGRKHFASLQGRIWLSN